MGRLLKNIGLALLFLVVVLILVNIFIILPLLRVAPVETAFIPAEEHPGDVVPVNAIVASDTLAVIRQKGNDGGPLYMGPDDADVRNPFFWPEKKIQKKKSVRPARKAPKLPQLSMVIIGEGRKEALMDDVFVREGDTYHGYLVKRIEEHQVVLVDNSGEVHINLATAANKKGMVQTPPGLIEQ
ncbi:MAG: hypothetical protein R3297_11625 [Desulfobulbales bacterium]|nr:hypothetical protein [Desulfobulbales bacterium]